MGKVRLFFGGLFTWVDQLLKGEKQVKTLQIILHFDPSSLELLADYYDTSWSSKDGAMFGKAYPLWHVIRAIPEAVEFARNNDYELLQLDAMDWHGPPKTLRVMNIQ